MDSRGISPVIGTLLLLAIVAILAAVLGTFALGFDDQLFQPAPQVALEVSEYDAAGDGNGGKPYLEINHRAGDIADGTKVSVRDESGNEVAWADVWTTGPTVGPGSYAHIDGCGSDGALDPVTTRGQTYSIVFKHDGRTLTIHEVDVPSEPTGTGTC
ncbi:type IV pilin [Halorarum halophilum]|uniref:Type IV pilin n=1 Tax=Halorarum halophilum TaxID=2743090 RepID=A0A7D5KTT9_9EURY|nr:type IV pilin [Halobaculum halophilum]QLG26620.1 type IV pilin [Halobaculum halophilum]